MEADERIIGKDLFFKLAPSELGELDKLELCFSLGDYDYVHFVPSPKVVAFYFKSVLRYMEEPLCTIHFYSKFRELCQKPQC